MNLPLIPGTLADPNCYPATPQALYLEMFERGVALLTPNLTGVILSDTEPGFADRDKVWVRTSAGAPVTPPIWIFFNGIWTAKHPVAAGTLWALPYTGSVASIPTLDGGSNVAVTANTGPFWEEVVSLQARMPIGAGTLPSGLVLAVGDQGGEENHELTVSELAPHQHNVDLGGQNMFGQTIGDSPTPLRITSAFGTHATTTSAQFNTDEAGGDPASGTPPANALGHNTLPPYVTLTFLRRTARIYCTQPIA